MVSSPKGQKYLSLEGEVRDSLPDAKYEKAAILLAGRDFYPDLQAKFPILDIMELFIFTLPAKDIIPDIRSLSAALGLPEPVNSFEAAKNLFAGADKLLEKLKALPPEEKETAIGIALVMKEKGGWEWADIVLQTLGYSGRKYGLTGFAVWEKLPEWEEVPPLFHAGSAPVSEKEALARLHSLLQTSSLDGKVEDRHEQADYTSAVCQAFAARKKENLPETVLAEAGTGVGKTLGYIAAASVWCDKNAGQVWISTFTKNLQKQLSSELAKLNMCGSQDDDADAEGTIGKTNIRPSQIVIRKGRENYICLLNYAEMVNRLNAIAPAAKWQAVVMGLIARLLYKTKDGDLSFGALSALFMDSRKAAFIRSLSDKRGECIYSACPYFKKCFPEGLIRKARNAKIVVANHALVMAVAAGMAEEGISPTRFIFDEGHHLFAAADSAFSSLLSGNKALDLHSWLNGNIKEGSPWRVSRNKGFTRRMEDLSASDDKIRKLVDDIMFKTSFLTKRGWLARIGRNEEEGVLEQFLGLIRTQVRARQDSLYEDDIYDLECEPFPLADGLKDKASSLTDAIKTVEKSVKELIGLIEDKLAKEQGVIEAADKNRYEGAIRQLKRKILDVFSEWKDVLNIITTGKIPADSVCRFVITKIEGHEADISVFRHYINPMIPFAKLMATNSHGILITSATLKDKTEQPVQDWAWAEERTGAKYLNPDVFKAGIASPFDYPAKAKVLIVTDIDKNNYRQVSSALRELFIASGGGAIGLFTSIKRLKAVYELIRRPLEETGIRLLAQHVQDMNTSSLVDIFKSDISSCMLGTDAVRDGIDIPGDSLRLMVLDRVPWSKPDILQKARKTAFGGEAYEKMMIRLRLIQAFGRLIRKKTDKGVFVILDKAIPSDILTAFPRGVEISKLPLKQVIAEIKEFL